MVDGKTTSIDVRCDLSCVVAPPSCYNKRAADGGIEARRYHWEKVPVAASQLPAMPDWLVTLVNTAGDGRASSSGTARRRVAGAPAGPAASADYVARLRPILERIIGTGVGRVSPVDNPKVCKPWKSLCASTRALD